MGRQSKKIILAITMGLGVCIGLSSCQRFSQKCLQAKKMQSMQRLATEMYNTGNELEDAQRNKRLQTAQDQVFEDCSERLARWIATKAASTP